MEPGWKKVQTGPGTYARVFELRQVACNTLEPFRACPVFDGDRLYLRGRKHLLCVEASAEDRKRSAPKEDAGDGNAPNPGDLFEDDKLF